MQSLFGFKSILNGFACDLLVVDLPFNLFSFSLSWHQSCCSCGSKTITSPFLLSLLVLLILENIEVPDCTEELVFLLRNEKRLPLLEGVNGS